MSEEKPRKRHYKRTLIVLATLSLISLISLAFATSIWSNEVEVTVRDYTLTLNDPADGALYSIFSFNGILNYDGAAVEGATVILYVNGTSTGLTDVTDAMGGYSIDWNATATGTSTFKTFAVVS